ncbi:hypothetical protein C8F01DRAFT_268109 [Mycena amicta]|nr:hypothetical protein C8F01DRAFT_268109 [Mycena amicta]
MTETTVSERFNATDADLTISSSDNILFKVHQINLKVHSEIFANMFDLATAKPEDVLRLSETSHALEILFQYMYCRPQPALSGLDFKICAGATEAAHKYVVHAAIPFLDMKMKDYIEKHALEVLIFAIRHDAKDLGNAAAHKCLELPLETAASVMQPRMFIKWAIFYDKWYTKARIDLAYPTNTECGILRREPTLAYAPPRYLRDFCEGNPKPVGYTSMEFME